MKTWEWTIPETAPFERADKLIARALEVKLGQWSGSEEMTLTRSRIQNLMEDGKITANGLSIGANTLLPAGTCIRIEVPAPAATAIVADSSIPLTILFEDEHIAVINKPAGLTVHPSETQRHGTLVHALLHHLKSLSGIGGELRPGIVHRLDKNTSGALVVSKTDAAHLKLSEIFSKHEIERVYWALCYGAPKDPRDIQLRTPEFQAHWQPTQQGIGALSNIGRSPVDRKKMANLKSGGREARTWLRLREKYQQAGQSPFASFWEAQLETGRTHQVRLHLTALGFPLLGDPTYGTPTENSQRWTSLPKEIQKQVPLLPGQALHARVLGFLHPITREPLHFEAPVPPAFEELQKSLARWNAS